ncbi:MAG: thiamine diphosphokinase [Clostridiales bacterium]|nr:thiamine diphosphokinase [Clostridiales bacterium]
MIQLTETLLNPEVTRRGLLITGGRPPSPPLIDQARQCCHFTLCADSGAACLSRMGIFPDLIIGDMDSLAPDIYAELQKSHCQTVVLPTEKDYTDTQVALEWLFDHDYEEVVLLGGTGSRWDHSAGNGFLLTGFGRRNKPIVMWDAVNAMRYISPGHYRVPASDHRLSLVPTDDAGIGLSLSGLYYPLEGADVPFGQSLLISNEFSEPYASIELMRGDAWLFVSRDD